MNEQLWQCTSCGKTKQLSRPGEKAEVLSDCWPCARKRKFIRVVAAAVTAPATSGPSASAQFPEAVAVEEDMQRARSGGASTASPRAPPTKVAAAKSASAAYAAWATSRIASGAKPPGILAPPKSPDSVPQALYESARSSSALSRAAAQQQTRTMGAAENNATTQRAPTLSPPLAFSRTPHSGTPSNPAVPPLPSGDLPAQIMAHRGRPGAAAFGTTPGFTAAPFPAQRARSHSTGAVTASPIEGVDSGADVADAPHQWICETCQKPKHLSGPHLAGKRTVRSDCWPCARKRTFHLVPVGAAAASALNTGGSLGDTVNTLLDTHNRSTTPLATVPEVALGAPAMPVTSQSASPWAAFDPSEFLRLVTVAQRAQLVREFRDSLDGGALRQTLSVVRPCPPTRDEYPMLYAIEHARYADAVPELPDFNSTPTERSASTTTTRWSGAAAPFSALSPVRLSASTSAAVSPERVVAAATIESLASLASRAATSVLHAAALLAPSRHAAVDLPDSAQPIRVGVFCNTHDEVAALAAYFALTHQSDSSMNFIVMGPPPEFTTSRTLASSVLAYLKNAGLSDAVVTPPVTHDERHWAVKHIARRSQGLVLGPASVLGFVVAERAHAAWKAAGQSPPDVSLVLLGRPARWDELPRVLQVVQALKESLGK